MQPIRKITISAAAALYFFATQVNLAAAQITGKIQAGLKSAGAAYTQGGTTDLATLAGSLISEAIGLLGILLLGLLLYGGVIWMTAGGDKAKVEKATAIIRNAVIGLIIVVLAYAISDFVLSSLGNATTGGTGTPTPTP
jgi:hypothetical protein